MTEDAPTSPAGSHRGAGPATGPRRRLFVPRPLTPAVEAAARARFALVLAERILTAEEVLAGAARQEAEAMIIGSNLRLDLDFVARLPASLRVVATTGVGTDHIDLAAAAARRIVVLNVPAIGAEDTADLTMMHILMACRRAPEYDGLMRAGWGRRFGFGEMLGRRVTGRRLGIVGMGNIGRKVADRARGFEMAVFYHHPRRLPERPETFCPDLDAMLAEVEIVSLHLPETAATRGLFSAERLGRLPRGAVLVNCARGGLVEEAALIAALENGQLAAAGLDVFHGEPKPDPRLLALPNVTLTPHAGTATREARDAIGFQCLDLVAQALEGRPLRDLAAPAGEPPVVPASA